MAAPEEEKKGNQDNPLSISSSNSTPNKEADGATFNSNVMIPGQELPKEFYDLKEALAYRLIINMQDEEL